MQTRDAGLARRSACDFIDNIIENTISHWLQICPDHFKLRGSFRAWNKTHLSSKKQDYNGTIAPSDAPMCPSWYYLEEFACCWCEDMLKLLFGVSKLFCKVFDQSQMGINLRVWKVELLAGNGGSNNGKPTPPAEACSGAGWSLGLFHFQSCSLERSTDPCYTIFTLNRCWEFAKISTRQPLVI